jgi:LPPG:FO 2-phospho-L-lactate transferase
LLTVLSGGTGTPKLLQGLRGLVEPSRLSVIVNTGEDVEISGLYVSPDVDTVMYTLAGIVNEETWYGISGDTFEAHERISRNGKPELLRIGDFDREVKRKRTNLLKAGKRLSTITEELCRSFCVPEKVMPMSDDRVETRVCTKEGPLGFHDFWVARRGRDLVLSVTYEGAEDAEPAPGVLEAIRESEKVIIGPSNPVTSVGPILAVKGIRPALVEARKKTIAVSPIIGGAPVSGPAGTLMRAAGKEVTALGVAQAYKDIASALVIDNRDKELVPEIERLGVKVFVTDLLMPDLVSRERLAREVLSFAGVKPR